jgi:hypothetical protein
MEGGDHHASAGGRVAHQRAHFSEKAQAKLATDSSAPWAAGSARSAGAENIPSVGVARFAH